MITMRKIFYFYFFYFDYNTNIECSVTRILYSKKNMNVNVFCKQIRRQYAIIVKYSYIRQKDLKQSNQSTKILVYSLLLYSSSGILTAVCQSLLIWLYVCFMIIQKCRLRIMSPCHTISSFCNTIYLSGKLLHCILNLKKILTNQLVTYILSFAFSQQQIGKHALYMRCKAFRCSYSNFTLIIFHVHVYYTKTWRILCIV